MHWSKTCWGTFKHTTELVRSDCRNKPFSSHMTAWVASDTRNVLPCYRADFLRSVFYCWFSETIYRRQVSLPHPSHCTDPVLAL